MTTEKTQRFTKDVLNHMRERLSDYQEQYGDLYNLEATPAESTSYRLAKHDVEHYPGIKTAAGDCGTPYYTNSSHLPVGYTEDIFTALDIQDGLQTLYTSGTVFHAFLGERMPDWRTTAALVRKIAENYELPYYTISPTYSVCKNHGYINGEEFKCPDCGAVTEVYSRITGYYRPVQNWNDGKTQEYKDRKVYNIANSKLTRNGVPSHESECGCGGHEHTATATLTAVPILFTTATCPNCKIACSLIERAGVEYEKLLADENAELAAQYGIKQAPTLVVFGDDGIEKYSGVSDIKRYLGL